MLSIPDLIGFMGVALLENLCTIQFDKIDPKFRCWV